MLHSGRSSDDRAGCCQCDGRVSGAEVVDVGSNGRRSLQLSGGERSRHEGLAAASVRVGVPVGVRVAVFCTIVCVAVIVVTLLLRRSLRLTSAHGD